ncbi:Neuronal pentraxin-2 [Oryzias melastigma]|uniref:Neuronal pentraxin-2 n=1 Tax=Oryzias melastigma TaxID=30732 RepID=A0A834BPS3_ORYME|nr:Neuronal pentraxin-2 [Oryzias melastigma]
MLALLVGLLYLVSGRTVRSQDATGSRFVCNAIPPGAEPGCGYGATGNRVQSSSPVEDELRNTIIQLRETILQQKETIVSQQGTIKELNSKLARCEAAADEMAQGKSRGQGSRRKEYGKNTMGDLPRDPGETIDQLGQNNAKPEGSPGELGAAEFAPPQLQRVSWRSVGPRSPATGAPPAAAGTSGGAGDPAPPEGGGAGGREEPALQLKQQPTANARRAR